MEEILMHLHNDPFQKVKDGYQTIEMRLYDEKRRKLKIGDIIEFKNRKNDETIKVQVTNLYIYDNFEELYKHHTKSELGYKETDVASPADMNLYYPSSEQIKNGVIAIKFEVIDT